MNKLGLTKETAKSAYKPQKKYYSVNRQKILQRIKIRNDQRKVNKTFYCKLCNKSYTDNKNLQKHLNGTRHAKKVNGGEHICKVCSYKTKYKQNFNTHLKSRKHARNSALAESTNSLPKPAATFSQSKKADVNVKEDE